MAADAQEAKLKKVDSAAPDDKVMHKRASSSLPGVFNINDLGTWLSSNLAVAAVLQGAIRPMSDKC